MGNCNCGNNKSIMSGTAPGDRPKVVPPTHIEGIVTKTKCPKCSYWMSLIIIPSTKEKSFLCQNTLCKYSMPYASLSQQQSPQQIL